MSDLGFHDGGEYVRDYILANIGIRMEGLTSDTPEYKTCQEIHNLITNKFGEIFTDLKG